MSIIFVGSPLAIDGLDGRNRSVIYHVIVSKIVDVRIKMMIKGSILQKAAQTLTLMLPLILNEAVH